MSLEPVVICVAPNGARRGKDAHAGLPLTPAEISAVAAACADEGATAIHLHVRDSQGRHSLAPDHYRAAIAAIESSVGNRMVVQVTTESAGIYTNADQMALVRELRPASVSIAIRELMPTAESVSAGASFYAWACEAKIRIQHIVYSPSEVVRLCELARADVLSDDRPHALFVLGKYSAQQQPSDPRDLVSMLANWPADWPFSTCAFGFTETSCATAAIGLGGHVRIGMENNLQRPDGSALTDQAEAVANIRRLIEHSGRALGSVADATRLFTL